MSRIFLNATDVVTVAASASLNSLPETTHCGWYSPIRQPDVAVINYSALWAKDPNGVYNGQWSGIGFPFTDTAFYASYPYPGSKSVSTSKLLPYEWVHIAFTFSNSGDKLIRMYLNGVETTYDQKQTGVVADDSAGDLYIGNDTFSAPALGKIYDYRAYNKALSAQELLVIATGGDAADPAPANLVCRLVFEQSTSSTEPDTSGSGNVGIITGAAFSSDNPDRVSFKF